MKLVSKSGRHSKSPSSSAVNPAPVEPEFDSSYLDNMLAEILGTKPAPRKASAPAKTEAPVRPNNSARPASAPRQHAPARQPEPVRRTEPVRKAEPVRQPEPVRRAEPVRQSESIHRIEPVRQPEPVYRPEPKEKIPSAIEEFDRENLGLDDEWDNPFLTEEEKTAERQRKARKSGTFDWELDEDDLRVDEATGLVDYDASAKSKKDRKAEKKKKKKRSFGRRLLRFIITLLILAGLYLFVVYTSFGPIASLRDAYIETAMSTMSHQWMAEWFFPESVIKEVTDRVEAAAQSQEGMESSWEEVYEEIERNKDKNNEELSDEEQFYELFWEIDRATFEDYLKDHPETLDDGWGEIYINEAGIEDNGTSIWTTMDEQVLAIDVPNKILLIRVEGSGYQGVLAVAKDSSRLSCTPAQNVGAYGERLEEIMTRTDSILGMTGSGFIDENGNGNGGEIVGYALCEGKSFGTQVGYPYKRIELREDNLLYIVDSGSPVNSAATDAVEFAPALIIDGNALIDQLTGYTSINPRACIGQSSKGEVLMLAIEGRLPARSFGCGLPECTEILMRHDAYQAMNLDGGTSAIMWYRGEYVIKCSNTNITCRTLPNAWIYAKEPVD